MRFRFQVRQTEKIMDRSFSILHQNTKKSKKDKRRKYKKVRMTIIETAYNVKVVFSERINKWILSVY